MGSHRVPRSFFYLRRGGSPGEGVAFIVQRRLWTRGGVRASRKRPKEKMLNLNLSRGRVEILSRSSSIGREVQFAAATITALEYAGQTGLVIRRRVAPRSCFGSARDDVLEVVFANADQRSYFASLLTACAPNLFAHARLAPRNRQPLPNYTLKVYCATWNMGNAPCDPAGLVPLVGAMSRGAYDVAAFGFQESHGSISGALESSIGKAYVLVKQASLGTIRIFVFVKRPLAGLVGRACRAP